MNRVLRLGALAAVLLALAQTAAIRPVFAASPIRNEPGDPFNRPPGLPKPRMVCAVGQDPARFICPARLGQPLSPCRCHGAREVGLRYFVYQPRAWPTIFTFDGTAW